MHRSFYLLLVCVILSSSFSGQTRQSGQRKAQKPTLSSLRQKYVGKYVVIQRPSPDWKGGSPREGILGVVTSVELNELHTTRSWGTPNAFGETRESRDSTEVDPYVDVTVRLADGSETHTTGYEYTFCCQRDRYQNKYLNFRLTTPPSVHAPIIKANLHSVVGKDLYALSSSLLYQPDTSRESLIGRWGGPISDTDKRHMGLLRPLRILKADYDEPSDSILLKLQLPDGKSALAVTTYIEEGASLPFLTKIEGSVFASVPSSFSAVDVQALRKGSLIIGMSVEALDEIYGYPDRENDWGRGGTQRVYHGGRLLVYLDRNERVVDRQYLDY